MIWLSVFVGITNTALIGLINMAATDVTNGESVTWQFFAFAAMLVLLLLVTRRSNDENIHSAQKLIYRFKIKIMSDVFKSNLGKIDEIGRNYIMEVLARDTQSVSTAVGVTVTTCQAIATLLFLTLYMATVSMTAFLIIFASTTLILIVGVTELFKVTGKLQRVAEREGQVNAIYADYLSGYKEIKMNSDRAYEITRQMVKESKKVNEEKGELVVTITNFFNNLQILLYVIVGIMVFVVPAISADFAPHVTTAATTALFLAGSLSGIIVNIPNLSQANVAARTLQGLAKRLAESAQQVPVDREEIYDQIHSITLEDVCYQHPSQEKRSGFMLGPINYQFDSGKVYFIRGNNGSGKTTLMRILIGLYQPSSGRILVNGHPISEPTTGAYRDMFAVVFSDFHLFKTLYGLPADDVRRLEDLLKVFQMEGKVSVQNGQFSSLQFSTGQRKRLALIVALLEDRPFIILDEWAADQDPEFRQEFYENIIPKLRAMGKTVIAITHDDHYYDRADHVLFMANGKPINS
ncbi:cyclic peptide export ABC transporter [Zwartia panacis]|uniref:cyclic peptide export ABC transporter n=1 Tax=Zwartia panacis TaxID=2683345 RepID=UPI0025B2CC45|nr:cyclic peptide export ABC transporter [Zwartia panacis]